VGTGYLEGKEIPPDQLLTDACRLKGGAPGDGLLRHPPQGGCRRRQCPLQSEDRPPDL